jgi:hypothetical protein
MIANRGVISGRAGCDRYLGNLSGFDVGVDLECANHEAVRRVEAGQLQRDRLALDAR